MKIKKLHQIVLDKEKANDMNTYLKNELSNKEYINVLKKLNVFLDTKHPIGKHCSTFRSNFFHKVYSPSTLYTMDIQEFFPELFDNDNLTPDEEKEYVDEIQKQIKYQTRNELNLENKIKRNPLLQDVSYWEIAKPNIIIVYMDKMFYCLDLYKLLHHFAKNDKIYNYKIKKRLPSKIENKLRKRYRLEIDMLKNGETLRFHQYELTNSEKEDLQTALNKFTNFKKLLNTSVKFKERLLQDGVSFLKTKPVYQYFSSEFINTIDKIKNNQTLIDMLFDYLNETIETIETKLYHSANLDQNKHANTIDTVDANKNDDVLDDAMENTINKHEKKFIDETVMPNLEFTFQLIDSYQQRLSNIKQVVIDQFKYTLTPEERLDLIHNLQNITEIENYLYIQKSSFHQLNAILLDHIHKLKSLLHNVKQIDGEQIVKISYTYINPIQIENELNIYYNEFNQLQKYNQEFMHSN